MSLPTLTVTNLPHVNQTYHDAAAMIDFYVENLGATRSRPSAEARPVATLMSFFSLGATLFEIFSPLDDSSLIAANLKRYGPIHHSFEWGVPDMEEAMEVFKAHGCRVMPAPPGMGYFFVHPSDTHGLLGEISDAFAQDPIPGRAELEQAADVNPLSIYKVSHVSLAVRDLDAASKFYTTLLGTEPAYERPWPALGGKAVGIQLPDHILELVGATGDGAIADYLAQHGQRFRSVRFAVRDLEQARRHLASRNLPVVAGDIDGTIRIAPEANFGLLYDLEQAAAV